MDSQQLVTQGAQSRELCRQLQRYVVCGKDVDLGQLTQSCKRRVHDLGDQFFSLESLQIQEVSS